MLTLPNICFLCILTLLHHVFVVFSTVSNRMKPWLGPAESAVNYFYSSIAAQGLSHYTSLWEHTSSFSLVFLWSDLVQIKE